MITFNTRTHAGWAAALALAALWPQAEAQAHGTMIHPYSRVYYCAQAISRTPPTPPAVPPPRSAAPRRSTTG